jgi:hypothetical protein
VKRAVLIALVGALLMAAGGIAFAATGDAQVRFVHTVPGSPAVDVAVVGGPVLVKDLAYPNASPYLSVAPATYDIEILSTGTSNILVRITGWQAIAGVQTTVRIIKASDGHLDVLPMTDVARTGYNVHGVPLLGLVLVLLGCCTVALGPVAYVAEGKRSRWSTAKHRIRDRGRVPTAAVAGLPAPMTELAAPAMPAPEEPAPPIRPRRGWVPCQAEEPAPPVGIGVPGGQIDTAHGTGVGRVLLVVGLCWVLARVIKGSA